jgi:hypothetical protein
MLIMQICVKETSASLRRDIRRELSGSLMRLGLQPNFMGYTPTEEVLAEAARVPLG